MTFVMLKRVDVLLHLHEPSIHQSESSIRAALLAHKLEIAAPSDQPPPARGPALMQNQAILIVTRKLDPPVTPGAHPSCHPLASPAGHWLPNPRPRPSGHSSPTPVPLPSTDRLALPIPAIRPQPPPSAWSSPSRAPAPQPPPFGFAGTDCHGPMDPPKMSLTGKG